MNADAFQAKIQQLKRDNQLDTALAMCEQWIDSTEAESRRGDPVESWPYLQACIILRKLKRPGDEVAVIERFLHQHSSGSKQSRDVVERLGKAYELAGLTATRDVDGQSVVFYLPENVPLDERAMFVHDAVVVDCETTGIAQDDELVELALLRFRYSHLTGRILGVIDRYSGLREPLKPISPMATRVSGIHASDVVGKHLDLDYASRLVDGASLVVAHNATFDQRMVEPLVPAMAAIPWHCTMRSIDWTAKGCSSKKLEELAIHYGITPSGHRALADAQLVLDLLSITDDATGLPVFHELIAGAPLGYTSRWLAAQQAMETLEDADDDDYDDDGGLDEETGNDATAFITIHLVAAPKPETSAPAAPPTKKKSIWSRLFG